jgi:hypothetical protein
MGHMLSTISASARSHITNVLSFSVSGFFPSLQQTDPAQTAMSSPNGLICFTNCLLPTEDGSLIEQDLWIDERRGVVLDSQVRRQIR